MYYFNLDLGTIILFKNWRLNHWFDVVLTMLFSATVAIIYQSFSAYHSYIMLTLRINKGRLTREQYEKLSTCKRRIYRHILATIIYMIQLAFAYTVMLLVMTFQGFIILAVIFGIGVGFYISDPFILVGMDKLYAKQQNLDRLSCKGSEDDMAEML